jgi:hypothetical protein
VATLKKRCPHAHSLGLFARDPLPNTAQAVIAVFELLSEKITLGEIEHVRRALPNDLRTIWPEPYAAPGAVR